MKWNKLEYGNWPKGKIVLRIVSDNGYVNYEIGEIEVDLDNETYFNAFSIDSIYDTEPHYIELDKLEMPS